MQRWPSHYYLPLANSSASAREENAWGSLRRLMLSTYLLLSVSWRWGAKRHCPGSYLGVEAGPDGDGCPTAMRATVSSWAGAARSPLCASWDLCGEETLTLLLARPLLACPEHPLAAHPIPPSTPPPPRAAPPASCTTPLWPCSRSSGKAVLDVTAVTNTDSSQQPVHEGQLLPELCHLPFVLFSCEHDTKTRLGTPGWTCKNRPIVS